jgi:hypothetical protein
MSTAEEAGEEQAHLRPVHRLAEVPRHRLGRLRNDAVEAVTDLAFVHARTGRQEVGSSLTRVAIPAHTDEVGLGVLSTTLCCERSNQQPEKGRRGKTTNEEDELTLVEHSDAVDAVPHALRGLVDGDGVAHSGREGELLESLDVAESDGAVETANRVVPASTSKE